MPPPSASYISQYKDKWTDFLKLGLYSFAETTIDPATGALLLGSPQQVIDKIPYEHELFGMDRFLLQLSVGTMPHAQMLRAIELYGTVVAPAVRKAIA